MSFLPKRWNDDENVKEKLRGRFHECLCFYVRKSQKHKRHLLCDCLFTLLGYTCVKPFCKHVGEIDPDPIWSLMWSLTIMSLLESSYFSGVFDFHHEMIQRVDFINILRTAFTRADPKKKKLMTWLSFLRIRDELKKLITFFTHILYNIFLNERKIV
jgi:hypothetical protein